ncbi:glucan endo-1,3-beta-D-glucosidase [Citrus sinensis]|uniref:Glucan endo-1,3-beta-D-glucosidase n=1 Tax=Citrus sinensis TaxID=2711 RepID=A0ACB8KZX9_CITSI|nr:glucan endo-1,3-beta-D-glucosidase [Citrus sinensis]
MWSTRSSGLVVLQASLLILRFAATTSAIGVNYGTIANNLPKPAEVANFLKTKTTIDAIKLFDANPEILRAFANTNISVTVSVGNGDIPALVQLPAAKNWVAANIVPFYPSTKIIRVVVGNEIMQSANKDWIYNLVPAMKSINNALIEAGIKDIKISTPNTLGFLGVSEPPSAGKFREGYDKDIIAPMLEFLRETKSAFMINPYPYFNYADSISDYILFKPNKGVYDPNTRITYSNMFDAQIDAVYSAMRALGYSDVPIVVAETGWPSAGDPRESSATVDNAASFNWNLIQKVNSGKGTPLMPNKQFETYIFALFNENQKPGATSERNFGLFKQDFTPTQPQPQPTDKKFCVPIPNTNPQSLQGNLDWVCSQGIDCAPIQPGGSCFEPNTLWSHAQYAMNAYYALKGRRDDNDCHFKQTALLTTNNPSYGSCVYA